MEHREGHDQQVNKMGLQGDITQNRMSLHNKKHKKDYGHIKVVARISGKKISLPACDNSLSMSGLGVG